MRLKRLKVHNYRSIRDLDMECQTMVKLLGPNNHGKSNLLSALEFGLSTSAKPTEADFFAHREDEQFWVEMTFCELTDQENNTFKRYVRSDGTVCVRKTCHRKDGGLETVYNGWVEQPDEAWLRGENAGDYGSREKIAATPLFDLIPPEGRITKAIVEEAQQQYIQAHRAELHFTEALEEGAFLGQKNIGGGTLPDFYLIPAIRDLTEEIKVKATTSFGRLLSRSIREMAERDDRFIQVKDQLKGLIASLNDRQVAGAGQPNELQVLEQGIEEELQSWGVKVNIEVTAPDIERVFELGTDLHLDDGIRTTADRKGHGLQRAVIFPLLRSWAKALRAKPMGEKELAPRKQSESVIFAMEEPELFLHPHAQRRLAASLRDIATTAEHQVFLCTHSTHFVDLAHYQEVAIVSKEDPVVGSRLRQCTAELFAGDGLAERKKQFQMAQWINPDRAEMFFARCVVFVEGETERVLLPYLAERFGVLDTDVSVIDCGSKFNLPLYIAIAKSFKLSYLVIHDEDPLPNPIPADWDEDKCKAKQRTFELNAQIAAIVEAPLGAVEMLSPDLEQASGVSKGRGKSIGKPIAALEHFDGLEADAIPERLKQVVQSAFPRGA
jgi:hypothetical protein